MLKPEGEAYRYWVRRLSLYAYTIALPALIEAWAGSIFDQISNGWIAYEWLASIVSSAIPDGVSLQLIRQSRRDPNRSTWADGRALRDEVEKMFLRRLFGLGWVVERKAAVTRVVYYPDLSQRRGPRSRHISFYVSVYTTRGQMLKMSNWEV